MLGGWSGEPWPFFESPLCVVTTPYQNDFRFPQTEIKDDPFFTVLRLVKAGYGTVNEIEKWGARKIINALDYEKYCQDYGLAFDEINKKE